MSEQLLKQAMALSQAGRRQEACELLVQVITADVHNERAWLLYANALPDEADRVKALEECLLHNPSSKEAQEELAALKGGAPPKPQTDDRPRTPTVPGSVRARTTGAPRRRLAYAFGGVVLLTGAAALLLLGWWIGQRHTTASPSLAERTTTPSTVSSGSEALPPTWTAEPTATRVPPTPQPTRTPTSSLTPVPADTPTPVPTFTATPSLISGSPRSFLPPQVDMPPGLELNTSSSGPSTSPNGEAYTLLFHNPGNFHLDETAVFVYFYLTIFAEEASAQSTFQAFRSDSARESLASVAPVAATPGTAESEWVEVSVPDVDEAAALLISGENDPYPQLYYMVGVREKNVVVLVSVVGSNTDGPTTDSLLRECIYYVSLVTERLRQ